MLFSKQISAFAACRALNETLSGQIKWPGTSDYVSSTTAIWSTSCHLAPECVFEPRKVEDLSRGIVLIRENGARFSVRGGGHMPSPGAQSVDHGIMISMSNFKDRLLSDDRAVASIGAGQLWKDVYDWLGGHGLAVNGGRYPTVGVGGVLLGGGIGYFAGSRGWSVDDIVGWQIVLSNGTTLEVTSAPGSRYEDLSWALKGGHNNFGVVTRFDMLTFPLDAAYGGLTVYHPEAADNFNKALIDYMAPGGGSEDPKSAINAVYTTRLSDGGSWQKSMFNIHVYAGGDPSPRSIENFTKISAEHVAMNTAQVHANWAAIPAGLSQFGQQGLRHLFWAITLKAGHESVSIAKQAFLEANLNQLTSVQEISLVLSIQPLTKVWLQVSKQKGGNLMGLDPEVDGGHFAIMLIPSWKDPRDDDRVMAFTRGAAAEIETLTRKLGLFNPFVYLNDASWTQKPFESYGGGNNLPKLRDIQLKYDPGGFVRDYMQHGFELGLTERNHGDEL
ncbi:FAD-binding domain-containing protein [Xylariaceae sp. FL1651]|nr:FAD-binding domain-containing protein [Xylariaceae sp. FL1651]